MLARTTLEDMRNRKNEQQEAVYQFLHELIYGTEEEQRRLRIEASRVCHLPEKEDES